AVVPSVYLKNKTYVVQQKQRLPSLRSFFATKSTYKESLHG
ncbi:unnamed protein product, partial [Amoebophrya sp. A120]